MHPKDVVILLIIILILGTVAVYLYRAKKKGAKCIGCPDACNCCKKQCDCTKEK